MAVDEQHRQSFEEQLKKANESNPFMIHNHIRATVLSEKTSQVRAEIGADSLNAMGGVHGGLMFVMAEIAAGLVTRNDGRRYVTLDSSFRFIRGTDSSQDLAAEGTIVKRGRTVCFTKASVKEAESGKLLADGDFTFYCLDAE